PPHRRERHRRPGRDPSQARSAVERGDRRARPAPHRVIRSTVREPCGWYSPSPNLFNLLYLALSGRPTIGKKSALPLTYHLLKQPPEQSRRLAQVLATLTDRVRMCERCFNL